MKTACASPESRSPTEILAAIERIGDFDAMQSILDQVPEFAILLNAERQILFGNQAVRRFAQGLGVDSIFGLRIGELFGCRNLAKAPSGCGTSEGCRTCGALQATLLAQHGTRTVMECRIATRTGTAYDLRVTASPFRLHDQEFALVLLGDISAEKRRQILERVFFHDVLNTAGGVSGLLTLMADDPSLYQALKDDLVVSSENLVNEIKNQQLLLNAENGQLQLHPEQVAAAEVLTNVEQVYSHHPVAEGKTITLQLDHADFVLATDPILLKRVLGNMVKNALEASKPGETVTLGAEPRDGGFEFWCHNNAVMPREVQLQLFQRSFSTKGSGRGIGTYSIRLFGEQYLGGRVGFLTGLEQGTRFHLWLPAELP
jgi:signal transduction histidine kinase